MCGGRVSDSSPSRRQLIKLGLAIFGISLCVSVAILAMVMLLTRPLSADSTRDGLAAQSVIVVVACLSSCCGLWRYLRMRIIQRHATSAGEQILQSKLRVAFWSYLLGWGVVFVNNVVITLLALQFLFKHH